MIHVAFILAVNMVAGTGMLCRHPRTLNLNHSTSMKAVSVENGAEFAKIKHGRNFKDLTGKKFGFAKVIKWAGRTNRPYRSLWLCRCVCGNEFTKTGTKLNFRKSVSCGCMTTSLKAVGMQTHARSGTPEYNVWCSMKRRCLVPSASSFKNYGGRGIKVCDRWLESFENFYADMGPRPPGRHSIERINNNGDYEPENCRWATQKEQCRNTRKNVFITINSQTKCSSEWAEIVGINPSTFYERMAKGWTGEKLLTTKQK